MELLGLMLAWTLLAPICGAVLGLALLIFWCVMIVRCIHSHNPDKALWLAVMLVTGPLGAGLYYFFGGRTRYREMIMAGIVIVLVILTCIGLLTVGSSFGPPVRPTAAPLLPSFLSPPTGPAPTLISLEGLMTQIASTPAP